MEISHETTQVGLYPPTRSYLPFETTKVALIYPKYTYATIPKFLEMNPHPEVMDFISNVEDYLHNLTAIPTYTGILIRIFIDLLWWTTYLLYHTSSYVYTVLENWSEEWYMLLNLLMLISYFAIPAGTIYCLYTILHGRFEIALADFVPPQQETTYDWRYWLRRYQLLLHLFMKYTMRGKRLSINDCSRLIDQALKRYPDFRRDFLHFRNVFKVKIMSEFHSHPKSASFRSAANTFMINVATQAGLKPYSVSCSKRDITNGVKGSRYFYGAKDLGMSYVHDKIEDDSCIIMTDVDYYANMPKWLELGKPILLYTFVPTTAAGRTSEYSYRIVGNEIEYTVRGGAVYKHKLWRYHGDTLVHRDSHGTMTTFSVEQRLIPNDEHHRLICLIPSARLEYPLSSLMQGGTTLTRMDLRNRTFYEPITDMLSIATSPYHSVEIPNKLYWAIQQRLSVKLATPVMADVERMIRNAGIEDASTVAAHLFGVMDVNVKANVVLTSTIDTNYHPVVPGSLVTEDGTPMGHSACSNLVTPGAAFPTKSEASDIATIQGRVDKPRNNKIPPREYSDFAGEFCRLVVPECGVGHIWQTDEVEAKQNTPLQRARIAQVKHTVTTTSGNANKAFVKAEAYPTANSPRNITTQSAETTLMMSCYTYPFKNEILKRLPWYAPGMTPQEICDRLKEICADGAIETDYNRFDGSISEWLQKKIVLTIYKRWHNKKDHKELEHWFSAVFTQKAITATGVKYNPGWGTRSGSPITTDGNTMINAFVMYSALRRSGKSSVEAFQSLGLLCGDDGFMPLVPGLASWIESTSADLGLSVDVIERRTGPYNFCGRRFIDPIVLPDSYQNLERTLPKLHLVTNGPESEEQRLANKAQGYLVTDPHTPLLSTWARRVIAITGLNVKNQKHEEKFKMNMPWPQTDIQAIRDAVCGDLELNDSDLTIMERSLEETNTLDAFPVIFDWEKEPKIPNVRSGFLETSGAHISQESSETTLEQQQSPTSKLNNNGTKPSTRSTKPIGAQNGLRVMGTKGPSSTVDIDNGAGCTGQQVSGPNGKRRRSTTRNRHRTSAPQTTGASSSNHRPTTTHTTHLAPSTTPNTTRTPRTINPADPPKPRPSGARLRLASA